MKTKISKETLLKLVLIGFIPAVVMLMSASFFFQRQWVAAGVSFFYLPISYFLLVGSLQNRIANTLPLYALVTYLILGIISSDWENASFIFFAVPFLSLLAKPKRYPFQYVILGLTIVFLVINHLTPIQIPWVLRLCVILVIYIIYWPPILQRGIEKRKQALGGKVNSFTKRGLNFMNKVTQGKDKAVEKK